MVLCSCVRTLYTVSYKGLQVGIPPMASKDPLLVILMAVVTSCLSLSDYREGGNIVLFISGSPMVNDVVHLFIFLLAICVYSSEKCQFRPLASFSVRLFTTKPCTFLLCSRCYLYPMCSVRLLSQSILQSYRNQDSMALANLTVVAKIDVDKCKGTHELTVN